MTRLALAAVAALAVAASACGGGENDADPAKNDPNLAKAVERTRERKSFAFEATYFLGDLPWSCDGVVDSTRRRSRVQCPGPDGKTEAITVDRRSYNRQPAGHGKWWKLPAGDGDLAPERSLPDRILRLLRTESQTERVDEEAVRGEPTVRYALTVDCDQLEFNDCAGAGATAVVDVWIDAEGTIRRVAFDEGMVSPLKIDFFDFGLPVEVEAPPAGQIEPFTAKPSTPGSTS